MLVVSTDLWRVGRGGGRGGRRARGGGGGGARALEDAEREAALRVAAVVENIADVEREDLVLPQPGPEGDAVDDVVAEPVEALPRELEQHALLTLRERARGARDGVGVGGHGGSPFGGSAGGGG